MLDNEGKAKYETITSNIAEKITQPLSYKDFFIIVMQALAITASFIPMLLGGGYPILVVLGVLALQFVFWYSLNAIEKQKDVTNNRSGGAYRKSDVVISNLEKLYEELGIKNKDQKKYINSRYLRLRKEYVEAKKELKDPSNKFDLWEGEDSLKEAYENLPEAVTHLDPNNIEQLLEKSKTWNKIIAKQNLKKHNNQSIEKVRPTLAKFLPKSLKEANYSETVEYLAGIIGTISAFVGNALGCAGSGFTITALLRSMPWFVATANLYAPILLTLALPIGLAVLLAVCGVYAQYYNTIPAIKQILKESLYVVGKDMKAEEDEPQGMVRTLVKYFSYFAAVVMAAAISTINFLTGNFIGWLFVNPNNVLNLTTTAMSTLSAPTTLLGIILGSASAAITFIALICLFSKYVPEGILGLFDNINKALFNKKPEEPSNDLRNEAEYGEFAKAKPKMTLPQPVSILSYTLITSFVLIVAYFATKSICFFVAAVLSPQLAPLAALCGSLMYFNQSFYIANTLFSTEALTSYYTKASAFAKSVATCKGQASAAKPNQITIETYKSISSPIIK